MKNPFDEVLKMKQNAEKKLQGLGARIRKNVIQGQKDWKTNKVKKYGSINPFK